MCPIGIQNNNYLEELYRKDDDVCLVSCDFGKERDLLELLWMCSIGNGNWKWIYRQF